MVFTTNLVNSIEEIRNSAYNSNKILIYQNGMFYYEYDPNIDDDEVIAGYYIKIKSNVLSGGWILKGSFPKVVTIYVSETGNDTNDGLSPDRPIYSTVGLINSLNLTYDSETGYYDASNIIINFKGTTSDEPRSFINPDLWVSNFRVFHNIKFHKVIASNVRFVFKAININVDDYNNGEDFEGQIYSFNGIELNDCAIQVCDETGNIYWSRREEVKFCECPFSYVDRFKTAFVVINGDFKLKMYEEFRLRPEHRSVPVFNPIVEIKNWGDVIINVGSIIGTHFGGGIVKGNVNKVKIINLDGFDGYFLSRTYPERDNIFINEMYIPDDNNPLGLIELTNTHRRFKMLNLTSVSTPFGADKTLRSLFLENPELLNENFNIKFIGSNYASFGQDLINAPKLIVGGGGISSLGNIKKLYYTILKGGERSLIDYFYSLDTKYIKNLDRRTLIRIYLSNSPVWIEHYFCESFLQTPVLILNPLQTESIITAETGDVLNIYLVSETTQQFSESYLDLAYIDLGTNYNMIEEIFIRNITTLGDTSNYDEYILEFSPNGTTWTSYGIDTSIWPRLDLTIDTTRTFKSYESYSLGLQNSNFAFHLRRYMRLIRVNTVGTPVRNFTNNITVIRRIYSYAPNSIIYYRKRIMGSGSPGKVHYFTNITATTQRIRIEYKFV
ncbi:MAG: hypothetical protein ACO2OX_03985 [Candidatus Nanopusillus sp.]